MKTSILSPVVFLTATIVGVFTVLSVSAQYRSDTVKAAQVRGLSITPSGNYQAEIVNLTQIAETQSTELDGEDAEPAEADTFLADPLRTGRPVPPGAISPGTMFPPDSIFNQRPAVPQVPSPATSVSFTALPDSTTSIPPDTHGAVGPNHVMTVLNSQIRVQNKSGGILLTTSLNAFWAPVAASGGVFDPKILYDPYTARWLFTACVGARSASSGVLLAVSQTADPTGSWFTYRAISDTTGVNWADYPSFGFNKDWVVISLNMFSVASNAFAETRTFVFRKAAVSAGTFSGVFFARPSSDGFSLAPAITYSSTEPTIFLLSSWNGNSGGNGFLRLYTITGSVGSELFTATNIFPNSGGRTWDFGLAANSGRQLGTTAGIHTNDHRMQNVVFRNGSLWATHAVATPSGAVSRSAVQWWQISPTSGATTQIGRIEDTSNAAFYVFPSIAVNQNNDVLIGYATFSSAFFASGGYAYRAASDVANTLRDPAILKSGVDCYFKTFGTGSNRWGDYSNTVVDPSDDTSFWTIQEYADPASPVSQCFDGSGRWGTWWGKVVDAAGCGSTAISMNQSVNGTLQSGDCLFSDNSYIDAYTFTATSGQQIYITMNSSQFNAYLFLYQGNYPGGTLLAQDNDGGGGTNARIPAGSGFFTIPATGTYTILANSLAAGETGFYTLFLGNNSPPPTRRPFDFDGDGRADISVFRTSIGDWFRLNSSTNAFVGQHFGANGDRSVPADFDGDGKTDLAVFRPSSGAWYWINSSTNTLSGVAFGQNGDLPVPADYDGDGRADIAVFRPSTATWFRINSSTNQFVAASFGLSTDKPAVGDYDGDGKADICVFRPSLGDWYRLNSSNGQFVGLHFGANGDKAVPANYDGDTKTDIAVFRPSNGTWFGINSGNGATFGVQFGANGDLPSPADFDGDGKADVAVFRPANGTWFLLRTTGGFTAVVFGTNGDIPSPNSFVY